MENIDKPEEREDLTKYLVENKENRKWYAGEQLEALRYFLSPKVNIIAEYIHGDYGGVCFSLMFIEEKMLFVLWLDYFGSCTFCDGLEGLNNKEVFNYIRNTLQEGNTKQFLNIGSVIKFLETTEDIKWSINYNDGGRQFLELIKNKIHI